MDAERLLRFVRGDEGAPEELVLEGVGVGGRGEDVVYPFRGCGAERRFGVGDCVEDELGRDCDGDFAGVEV